MCNASARPKRIPFWPACCVLAAALVLVGVPSLLVAAWHGLVYVLALDNDARETLGQYSVPLAQAPETDREFLAAGEAALRQANWWTGELYLTSIDFKTPCREPLSRSGQRRLDYWRWEPLTLITGLSQSATVEYDPRVGQVLRYTLYDDGGSNDRPTRRVPESGIPDTFDLLLQAEAAGGREVREAVNNRCYVRILIGLDGDAGVNYLEERYRNPLMCFDIHPDGRIDIFSERSPQPCRTYP